LFPQYTNPKGIAKEKNAIRRYKRMESFSVSRGIFLIFISRRINIEARTKR
jgi:hypothetical protein